jgi:hypothetical protein
MSDDRYDSVALLTCGESVYESWDTDWGWFQYGEVIGVNWIGCDPRFDLDWLCVKDRSVMDDERVVMPNNGMVIAGGVPKRWKASIDYENFEDWSKEDCWAGPRVCGYTFPDALRWALRSFPDARVDVFGLDMDGKQGACRNNGRHDAVRWSAEMPWLRHLFLRYGDRIRLKGCRKEMSCFLAG